MSVDWEKVQWYSRSRGSAETGPSVTISKPGRVVLNEEALNLFSERPEAFQVGIFQGNRGKVSLVLQAASKGDSGSLALSKQGTKFSLNTSKFLTDRGLTDHFNSNKASKPEFDEEHNALIINI